MAGDPLLTGLNILSLVLILIFAWPAYWAFSIRRSLASRIHRNQALGVGLVSIAAAINAAAGAVPLYFFPDNVALVDEVFWPMVLAGFLMIIYWVDSTIVANRRVDPLLRDTLQWRRARIAVWLLSIVAVVISLGYLFYAVAVNDSSVLNTLYSGIGSGAGPAPVGAEASLPWLVSLSGFLIFGPLYFVVCLVYIPAMAVRARQNPLVQKYLKWASLGIVIDFVVAVFALPPGANLFNYGNDLILIVMYPLVSYFLYRSIRALNPISRIPADLP